MPTHSLFHNEATHVDIIKSYRSIFNLTLASGGQLGEVEMMEKNKSFLLKQ